MTRVAVCRIREQPQYRRDAFVNGLQTNGYKVESFGGKPHARDDLLLIWNRYGEYETDAERWEKAGGTVLVVENGYIGTDDQNRILYAISAHQHNGGGWFPVGTEDRWSARGIEVKPWREGGEYVLVCGQRGIGSKMMASPAEWHGHAAMRLHKAGVEHIRVRHHPGEKGGFTPPSNTLDEDLAGARVCVIWSSSSGIKALVQGVPVAYDAPRWICEGGATHGVETATEPLRDDGRRLAALQRMAHSQWTVDEIAAGEPFARFRKQLEAQA